MKNKQNENWKKEMILQTEGSSADNILLQPHLDSTKFGR